MKVRVYAEERVQMLLMHLSDAKYSIAKPCIDILLSTQILEVKDEKEAEGEKHNNKMVKSV